VTPAEALAPQPPPTHSEESRSVTDWLTNGPSLDPELVELLIARREQGRARYGTELETHNGRDPRVDALQEALDLVAYLGQAAMEREGIGKIDPVLLDAFVLSGLLLGALAGHLGLRSSDEPEPR
jgi:hypothetical protein